MVSKIGGFNGSRMNCRVCSAICLKLALVFFWPRLKQTSIVLVLSGCRFVRLGTSPAFITCECVCVSVSV